MTRFHLPWSKSVVAVIAALAVTLFFLQGVFFIRTNGSTYDEAMHLAAGYSYLATGDFRLEPQNPPLIKILLAAPVFLGYQLPFPADSDQWRNGEAYLLGQRLMFRSDASADRILLIARLPNLLLGCILVALVGWWAYRAWGAGGAAVALIAAAFEPNLVAHSSLVTTDIGLTLFVTLAFYFLWEYSRRRSYLLLGAAGIALGTALASKFSAVLFVPIVAMLIALTHLRDTTVTDFGSRLLRGTGAFLVVIAFASLVIPTAYFLRGFEPWLSGLTTFLRLAQDGQPAYFLGEVAYEGFRAYYPIAFLIKTPLGSLLLIAAALIFFPANTPRRHDAIFLLLPVAFVFLVMTQAKVNIGLRHILPVYPLLFVFVAHLATTLERRRWAIAAALTFTAVSVLRVAPYHLVYFNEFVGGPARGYRYLGDSNLDWGQNLKSVKEYMDGERLPIIYLSYFGTAPPAYYGIRYQYVPGTWPLEWPPPSEAVPASEPRKILAVSAHHLQEVATPRDPLFRWLETRKPVGNLGYSIWLYDLTDDIDGLHQLRDSYRKVGLTPPAENRSQESDHRAP